MARTKIRESTQILPQTFTTTSTGNIDDLDFGNAALIRMNNASLATIRGLKAGSDGQVVTIRSIGAGEVDFAHQNTNSAIGNRLINFATVGITPLAAGIGAAIYQYDATTARWILISHQQGAWINVAYSAGNFSCDVGTWTVNSGSQSAYAFFLNGKTVTMACTIINTALSSASTTNLYIAIPNSWLPVIADERAVMEVLNSGAYTGFVRVVANTGNLILYHDYSAGFWNQDLAGNSAVYPYISFEIK